MQKERVFEASSVRKDLGAPSSLSKQDFLPLPSFIGVEVPSKYFWIRKEKEVGNLDLF